MYINAFLAGILATIFAEMTAVFVWALWCAYRGR